MISKIVVIFDVPWIILASIALVTWFRDIICEREHHDGSGVCWGATQKPLGTLLANILAACLMATLDTISKVVRKHFCNSQWVWSLLYIILPIKCMIKTEWHLNGICTLECLFYSCELDSLSLMPYAKKTRIIFTLWQNCHKIWAVKYETLVTSHLAQHPTLTSAI